MTHLPLPPLPPLRPPVLFSPSSPFVTICHHHLWCAGKDYQAACRTVVFALKGGENVGVREKVLKGELTPEAVALMSPEELRAA